MVALTALAGETALTLIAGPAYAKAAPLLIILSIAAAIDLCGFALEPALLAAGHAGRALIARAGAATIYILCLVLALDRWGAQGAALAAVAGSAIALSLSALFVQRVSARRARQPTVQSDPAP